MKKFIAIFAAFCIFLPTLVFANTQVLPKSANTKDDHALLVLVSKEASLKAADKSGSYQLTLKGVNPKVIYFLDRPERKTGQISLDKFIKQWAKGGTFNQDAPNAVIEVVRLNAKTKKLESNETTYAVTLYNPASLNKNQMNFEIKPLPGNDTKLPTTAASDYVAIFIDDVCLSCIG